MEVIYFDFNLIEKFIDFEFGFCRDIEFFFLKYLCYVLVCCMCIVYYFYISNYCFVCECFVYKKYFY